MELKQKIEQLMSNFKDEVLKVQVQTIDEYYCGLLPYFEDDLIANIKTSIIRDLKYSDKKGTLDFKEIRKKIFEENKTEIIEDLNQDNLKEIERLKEWINELLAKD